MVLLTLGAGAEYPPPHRFGWFMLDSSRSGIVPEATEQDIPKLTFDGSNFLAFWRDCRNRPNGLGSSIYAARLGPEGTVLDPLGVQVARLTGNDWLREIGCASSGSNSLVAWACESGESSLSLVAVRRLAPDLTPLDSAPVVLTVGGTCPRVAYCADRYLVIWGSDSIFGTRITTGGLVLDSAPVLMYTTQLTYDYQLASDSQRFFLVVQSHSGLVGLLIDTSGTVQDTVVIRRPTGRPPTDDEESQFGLAFGNGSYFVSFVEGEPDREVLYGTRIAASGVVLDTTPITIDSVYAADPVDFCMASAGAGVYLVVLKQPENDHIYCRRVSTAGVVLDTTWIVVSERPEMDGEPAVAFGDGEFVVAWKHEDSRWDPDIRYARVLPDGSVLSPGGSVLSTAAPQNDHSDVASDGTNYLFVWADTRNSAQDAEAYNISVYGVLVSPDGAILEPGPFAIAEDSAAAPRVCFGGGSYFVSWFDTKHDPLASDIYGARVSPQGVVLDPGGLPIFARSNTTESRQAVVFDGRNYVTVCRAVVGSLTTPLYGARVTPDGILLDTSGFVIDSDCDGFPEMATNGSVCLVTYNRRTAHASLVEGRLIWPDATVSDSFSISLVPADVKTEPFVVASDGGGFFVAWPSYSYGGSASGACFGTRVTAEGQVLDSAGIPLGGTYPAGLVFDDTDYAFLRGSRTGAASINLSYIARSGVPHDTCGITLRTTQDRMRYPRLGKGPADQLAVVVSDFAAEPYNTHRAYATLFRPTGILERSPARPSPQLRLTQTIARSTLIVEFEPPTSGDLRLRIRGADGRLLHTPTETRLRGGRHRALDVSRLAVGVYFLSVGSGPSYKFIVCR